jgi:hypothetical protein
MREFRDLCHGFLREILAKRPLAGNMGLLDVPGRDGLADRHQLDGACMPTGGVRRTLDTRPDSLQVGGNWGHNFCVAPAWREGRKIRMLSRFVNLLYRR